MTTTTRTTETIMPATLTGIRYYPTKRGTQHWRAIAITPHGDELFISMYQEDVVTLLNSIGHEALAHNLRKPVTSAFSVNWPMNATYIIGSNRSFPAEIMHRSDGSTRVYSINGRQVRHTVQEALATPAPKPKPRAVHLMNDDYQLTINRAVYAEIHRILRVPADQRDRSTVRRLRWWTSCFPELIDRMKSLMENN